MLDSGAQILPRMVIQPNSELLIESAPFLKYHTAASSTPSLVMKAFEDLGQLGQSVFTTDGIAAARDAQAHLHDLALSNLIPLRDITMAHAYLSAVEVLPNNWYQGKKAVDSQPPSMYRAWKVFFTKYSALAPNT